MANDQNTPQPQPQPQQDQQGSNPATSTTPKQPATTQEELLNDSGAGIRGGYGDSDQTNGLEGGGQTKSDRSDIQQSAQE